MKAYRLCFGVAALCLALVYSISIPQLSAQTEDGIELLHSSRFAEAEGKFRAALNADPKDNAARYYLGITLLNQQKYKEALEQFQAAESKLKMAGKTSGADVPNSYQLNLAMGQTYLELQRYDEALAKLELAGKENSNSSDVYLYRGACLYKQKDFEKAIKDLEKAIKLDAKNAYAYYYAGMTYYAMSQPAKMVEVFKIFLQLAPTAPEAPAVKKLVDENC